MSKPLIIEHNIETNVITEREMNDVEFAEWQENADALVAENVAQEAKATAKAALLDKLGITAEEAQLLLGGN